MSEATAKPEETPEGAAVFPLIPEELGVHPLLLAALHAYVFLEGSEAKVLNPAVAEEAPGQRVRPQRQGVCRHNLVSLRGAHGDTLKQICPIIPTRSSSR